MAYWLTSTNSYGCVEAGDEPDARRIFKAETGEDAIECDTLPYPANPRLNKKIYKTTSGSEVTMPSFCFTPWKCKGKTSCPRNRACDD